MIRVIAVDDELPALRRIGKLLKTFEDVQVDGLFDKSQAFLEHVLTTPEPIDLVVLDMEMPLHGLEVARRLRTFRPEIHIAFLTAHETYAVDAFDVEALDYLLKPVEREGLERMFNRFLNRVGRTAAADAAAEPGLTVRCFGPFEAETAGGRQIKFRNSKGRELLAYLHACGGRPVSKARIMEEIWPGGDEERTRANLYSTMYQLRKDLEACGLEEIIEQTKTAGGSYRLQWPVAFDDVAAFEREVQAYKQTSSIKHVLSAVQLYGDGYLFGSGYGWAAPRQAELELVYTELLEAMSDTYVRQQRYPIALNPMEKWVQLAPLNVRIHAKMVALLLLMDRRADALEYHRLASGILTGEESLTELDFARIASDPAALF